MKEALRRMKKKGWLALLMVLAVVAAVVVNPFDLIVNASGYNPQAACDYAEAWGGSRRNPDYTSYSNADCMNYVSQCLRAGGLDLGSDWQPYTASWVGCVSFVNAMRNRGYQVIENPTADQIYPGNPVIYQWKGSSYEWSHATICVGYNSNGTPIVNGHTRDREHVSWNYGASSANRMCTVLINDGSDTTGKLLESLGNPMDLGGEFYAYMYNDMSGKMITNDVDNVTIRTKGDTDDEIQRQVWRFERQSDNSYIIYSSYNNKVLDVYGAIDNPGNNVGTYEQWGEYNTAQRWNIYAKDGAYALRPLLSGTCMLDVANAETGEGTNIQIATINGSAAQNFQIQMVGVPEAPVLSCTPGTNKTETIFTWNTTSNTNYYNIYLDGTGIGAGTQIQSTSFSEKLEPGTYQVYIEACNAYAKTVSNIVNFEVAKEEEATTEAPTTTEEPTTEVPATTEESTTEEATTEAPATTEESTTEKATTEAPATTEESTTEEATTEAPASKEDKTNAVTNITTILNYIMGGKTENTTNSTVVVTTDETSDQETTDEVKTENAMTKPGIRLVSDKSQDGVLIGLYLQIILPGDGDGHIITIRLI